MAPRHSISIFICSASILGLTGTAMAVPHFPAPIPVTGQTTSYDANSPPRDDGALQKGVVSPNPRFTKNVNISKDYNHNGICDGHESCNGTITDRLTGLIWLQNANCPNTGGDWQTALDNVVQLNTNGTINGNDCGDTSKAGSHQTDWRLPNVRELQSLVDYGQSYPTLPSNHPFVNFEATYYWSATTDAASGAGSLAWIWDFSSGGLFGGDKAFFIDGHVLAVRQGSICVKGAYGCATSP